MTTRISELPNGFRVVTENMPGLKSASVGIWVSAGARHEAEAQNGIAHFLEHMAFKGTARRTARQIAEQIEDVGGYINAWTSRETTAYYARVLEADVPLAVDLLADIVLNPAFDPREIEVERGVILQEIGQVLDTPDDIIFDWLQQVAYPGQPLGRTILGPEERVAGFTADDLRLFVSQHYRPERMIMAAAGAVDHDTILREAETLFGHLPRGDGEHLSPANYTGGEHRVQKKLEQAHMALAFEIPGFKDDAIWTAQIYSSALGGGMSSRLFQEVREKHGLCYSIYAQAGAHAETGLMTIYAGTSGADLGPLTLITLDEMKRAAADMNETEINRARTQMKAGMLMGLESPASRAERLARLTAIWGRIPDLDETVAKLDAVTVADIRAFGEKLTHSAPALALYGPVGKAPSFERIRDRLAA